MKLELIIVVLTTLLVMSCSMFLLEHSFQMPDLSEKADGVYRGNYKITPVKVTLDVIVQDNKITGIDIIEHFSSPIGRNAEKIVDRIIQRQSLDVDVVTGASISSKAIMGAVENALQ